MKRTFTERCHSHACCRKICHIRFRRLLPSLLSFALKHTAVPFTNGWPWDWTQWKCLGGFTSLWRIGLAFFPALLSTFYGVGPNFLRNLPATFDRWFLSAQLLQLRPHLWALFTGFGNFPFINGLSCHSVGWYKCSVQLKFHSWQNLTISPLKSTITYRALVYTPMSCPRTTPAFQEYSMAAKASRIENDKRVSKACVLQAVLENPHVI